MHHSRWGQLHAANGLVVEYCGEQTDNFRTVMCESDPRSGAHQVRSQAHIVGQEVYGVDFVEREYGEELGSSDTVQ